MKYLSLFSGIEAASVAWKDLDWECVGVCEIDKFASAVLKHHYPTVPNFGDITTLSEEKLNEIKDIHANEPLLVIGGSPCQSFSICGKKRGLDDPRGNLMFEYVRVVKTLQPKYFIWENVPNVLSKGMSSAFGTLLRAMVECGYSLGWRVLDAQYFGVAQRRRRVFLVGCLGEESPFEILFESKGMQGNNKSSEKSKKSDTTNTSGSIGEHDQAFLTNARSEVRLSGGDGKIAGCLSASSGINQTNYIAERVMLESNQNHAQIAVNPTTSYTLTAAMGMGGGHVPMIAQQEVSMLKNTQSSTSVYEPAHVSFTLTANMGMGGGHVPMISDPKVLRKKVGTLVARDYKGPSREWIDQGKYIPQMGKVRKLTPLECERLQGFPDNYTRISWNGKEEDECPTSPRYKTLGNSMAVPVMRWLGERIDMFEKHGNCNGYKFVCKKKV